MMNTRQLASSTRQKAATHTDDSDFDDGDLDDDDASEPGEPASNFDSDFLSTSQSCRKGTFERTNQDATLFKLETGGAR